MPDPTSAEPRPALWNFDVHIQCRAELDTLRHEHQAHHAVCSATPAICSHEAELDALRARLVQTEAALQAGIRLSTALTMHEPSDQLRYAFNAALRAIPEAPPVAAGEQP